MRWLRLAAHLGEKRNECMVLVRGTEGKRTLRRLRHRLGIILKWILQNRMAGYGLDSSGSG
jgi:hypothetical protein